MAPNFGMEPILESPLVPIKKTKEILYDGNLYDVTEWINRHPGGKILEIFTKNGEDATIPIEQFHTRSEGRVNNIMSSLKKRPATSDALTEAGFHKDIIANNKALTDDFRALTKEIKAEGLFDPVPTHVIYRFAEVIAFAVFGMYFITRENIFLKIIGICLMGLYQGRSGWLMHEGGHHSITGYPKIDRFLQALVLGTGFGLSSIWWSSQHHRHHAMPQREQHDVDLKTLPMVAFNKKVVKDPKDGKNFFIRNQVWLFASILQLIVEFQWKFVFHPRYVIRRGQYSQFLFMAPHYVLAYYMGVIPYLCAAWLGANYMLGNFALSHTHHDITSEPTHWVTYALMYTTNMTPSWFCNWWMGFLNFQIEHHLFPAVPEFRLPLIADRVKELAKKHGLPYNCVPYFTAVHKTFANLGQVAKELQEQ